MIHHVKENFMVAQKPPSDIVDLHEPIAEEMGEDVAGDEKELHGPQAEDDVWMVAMNINLIEGTVAARVCFY
jgi:hypothetical protein